MEQPADRDTLTTYDVDAEVLERWRKTRNEYLSARAALVGSVERQAWRAPPAPQRPVGTPQGAVPPDVRSGPRPRRFRR